MKNAMHPLIPYTLALVILSAVTPGSVRAQSSEPVFIVDGAFRAEAQAGVGSGIGGDDPDVLFLIKNSLDDPDDILLRVARADNTFRFKVDEDGDIHFPGMGGTTSDNDWNVLYWAGGSSRQIKIKPFSSRHYKTDIQSYSPNLEALLRAEVKTWTGIKNEAGRRGIGFITEEIEALGLTDLVIYDEQGRPDGIRFADLHLYQAELMRRQQAQLNDLDERLARRNAEATRLQTEVERLLDRIDALEPSTPTPRGSGLRFSSASNQ